MALIQSEANQTLIMGVVNITPDSFSDGGSYLDPEKALTQIEKLVTEGADIVDLGAESSRPGAEHVSLEEEWRRLAPVLEQIRERFPKTLFSLDSYKSEIMRRALAYPVSIINDIRGGTDQETLEFIAERKCIYLAMHMHRSPQTMQTEPLDGTEAVAELESFYKDTHQRLRSIGFSSESIWLDPGIGFGKTDRANLQLIRQAIKRADDFNIVLGVSRKSFIGRLLDVPNPLDRDPPTKMLEFSFLLSGIKAIRTHDVQKLRMMRDLL